MILEMELKETSFVLLGTHRHSDSSLVWPFLYIFWRTQLHWMTMQTRSISFSLRQKGFFRTNVALFSDSRASTTFSIATYSSLSSFSPSFLPPVNINPSSSLVESSQSWNYELHFITSPPLGWEGRASDASTHPSLNHWFFKHLLEAHINLLGKFIVCIGSRRFSFESIKGFFHDRKDLIKLVIWNVYKNVERLNYFDDDLL